MRLDLLTSPVLVLLTASPVLFGCSQQDESAQATRPSRADDPKPTCVWVPSEELAGKLAEPVVLEGFDSYEIRPPKGYTAQVRDAGTDAKIYTWSGPEVQHPGNVKTIHTLYVRVRKVKGNGTNADQEMKDQLRIDSDGKDGWTASDTAERDLGGLKFLQTAFHCQHKQFAEMKGFTFTAVDGDVAIRIYSGDYAASGFASVELARAAALSFRKRNT